MALNKVPYVDGVTVITAENLNDIQDAIIALENSPAQGLTEDMKQALLQIARKVAYIDDQGQTYYDDLYDAFYPPKTVVLITAVFEQGSTVIYDDTALDDLKQYLTVTAKYDDNTTAILADGAYTLSGLLEAGTSTVTVAYNGLTTTFTVNVTARPTLSSISAVYTQSGTVYDINTLDSLKADLVVTAHYSDSSTQTVPAADYTLSGTLTVGTSTITVSYGGKTTTFNVTVSNREVPSGYEAVDYIFSPNSSSAGPIIDTGVRFSGVGDAIIEVSFMDYSSDNSYPIGCLDSTITDEIGFGVSIRNDSNKDVIAYTGGTPASISPSPLNNVRIDAVATVNSSGISITDGTLSNTQTLTPRAYNVSNIYIFGIKNAASSGVYFPFTGRIYYAKVTENNVVKLELLPCIRLSDGMAGFWDVVNENFIYSTELVAAPSEHNTTAEIEFPGYRNYSNGDAPTLVKSAVNGVTKKYQIAETTSWFMAGILPYSGSALTKNTVSSIYDDQGTYLDYASEYMTTGRWAQAAGGTLTEYSTQWIVVPYTQVDFCVDMRHLHDAYMYDKNTGKVWFAGRNTPYYGMSNISEAQ